jgi:hypothetical protein
MDKQSTMDSHMSRQPNRALGVGDTALDRPVGVHAGLDSHGQLHFLVGGQELGAGHLLEVATDEIDLVLRLRRFQPSVGVHTNLGLRAPGTRVAGGGIGSSRAGVTCVARVGGCVAWCLLTPGTGVEEVRHA